MKKLLLALGVLVSLSAFAITYPVPGIGTLSSPRGTWESTIPYSVKPIKGTYYNATPLVTDTEGTFVMSNESAATIGIKPESQPASWKQI